MYARQRSFSTAATSIRYGRPPMDSSKRWTTVFTVSAKKNWGGAMRIVRAPAPQTSEAKDENASTLLAGIVSRRQPARKKFTFSVAAQEIHRSSTGFAQMDALTASRWHTTLETS